uniref:Nuclear factor of activated T cells 1 n=1 Tax=Nothobranchius furzeri TaxID=105023 RepID=A0A8C6MHG8_NOTFU
HRLAEEEHAFGYTPNVSLPLPLGNPCLPSQYHSLQSSPSISVSVAEPQVFESQDEIQAAGFYSAVRPNGAPTLESPRIEITAYGQFPEEEVEESSPPTAKRVNSVVTLNLPSADGYRDPSCLSPASSVSDASYESSFSYNYDNSPQNSPWQSPSVSPKGSTLTLPGEGGASVSSPQHSPSASPRTIVTDDSWMGPRVSRPNSPCGAKRKYSFNGSDASRRSFPYSPNNSPSPQTSPRLSVTDENWMPNTNQYTNSAILAAINALTTDGVTDLGEGIPIKARKTSLDHSPTVSLKVEPRGDELSPNRVALKREGFGGGFLDVPQHSFSWPKPKPYASPSQPALDWQLPSSSGPYSLQIEVQPKSHHRAHYETEGSRGAVKALAGGHPVVQLHGYMENEPLTLQLFIGTADDRLLRPHAFYQVHRITGKTVSTPSHEVLHNNTKVLEIPLLPENNMRAIIDCAGILKLRNSDIELRKGETDIGRKNTRVRMVFRVHLTQTTGRTVSLQAASNPIECSQRSAQELPLVDKQSLETGPACGGDRMLLDGHNFQLDSKVVFVEKAQDGHHLWETEAKVERSLMSVSEAASVLTTNRHTQTFRKLFSHAAFPPLLIVPTIKTEPHDDYDVPLMCTHHGSGLALHPKPFYLPSAVTPMISGLQAVVGGAYSASQQTPTPKPISLTPTSPSTSPKLQDLSPPPFSKCPPEPQAPQVSIIQETPGRYQPPGFFPPSSSSSPAASQPSTPTEVPFSSPHGVTPPHSVSGCTSSASQQLSKVPESDRSSLQEDNSPPMQAVSIKQEPQELDQMYLDDVIRVNSWLKRHVFLTP